MVKKKIIVKKQASLKQPPIGTKSPVTKFYLKPAWQMAGVLLLTFLVYIKFTSAGFIYYSDDLYVLNNDLVKDLSLKGIANIFTSYFYHGYIPITLLSYAIEYALWGATPFLYVLTSLLIHLLNTILVYHFIRQLVNDNFTPVLTALLFAIHPMHVESVMWIAERKDLLFAFFYLAGAILYINYLRNGFKYKTFALIVLMLLLSMFSKPSALTFPALLILLDYYTGRKISKRLIMEKIFLFAIIIGIGVVYYVNFPQHVEEATFSFIDRIFMGGYAFLFYVVKLIAPFNLSLIRPYPTLPLPSLYYIATVISLILTIASVLYIVRRYRQSRDIIFGLMFFLIHISLVLHIATPIGGVVIVADRYTYLPYLGFFFIAGTYYVKNRSKKTVAQVLRAAFLALIILYSVLTYQRVPVWHNAETMYTDIISKNPDAWQAYNNLGFIYSEKNRDNEALALFDKAIELRPDYAKAHFNRGVIHYRNDNYDKALSDFTDAATFDSLNPETFYKKALCHYNLNKPVEALADFTKTISLNPRHADAYNDRGWIRFEQFDYDSAMSDFDKAILYDSLFDMAYNNRGWLRFTQKDYDGALSDFNKAIAINATVPLFFINRGWLKHTLQDFTGAIIDYNTAGDISPNYPKVYSNRSLSYLALNKRSEACADLRKAYELGVVGSLDLIKLYCSE